MRGFCIKKTASDVGAVFWQTFFAPWLEVCPRWYEPRRIRRNFREILPQFSPFSVQDWSKQTLSSI
jgi:hypothetical protein